eukprot:scaffold954_cov173-Ochromonas_danica.AAC.11
MISGSRISHPSRHAPVLGGAVEEGGNRATFGNSDFRRGNAREEERREKLPLFTLFLSNNTRKYENTKTLPPDGPFSSDIGQILVRNPTTEPAHFGFHSPQSK